ncbi:MAG: DUF1553 domain-containing protein [Verrucomicrobiae bacterium]|nr:DUF1553 domain-containing protein [Verrucomicrobiae bacterium]
MKTLLIIFAALLVHDTVASDHWAFQPVRRPEVPVVAGLVSEANPIDAFILRQLGEAGMGFAPEATAERLIRRMALDLIGLPPKPDEVEVFVKAFSSDPERACSALIDRLLESPHYGERWGRHWLDVARFAETDGFEHDAVRPHAWRYRDYVIRSYNDDKPYDRFICEQVAGDVLWPDEPQARIATGFNLLGPDMVDSADQEQRRLNRLTDMTDTTALAFVGLTMGCAKCHDHPFEPITQREYYGLQAFYTPLDFNDAAPVYTPAELSSHKMDLARYESRAEVVALAAFDMEHRPAGRKLSHKAYLKTLSKDEKAARDKLEESARRYKRPELPAALTVSYPSGPWRKTRLLNRGEYSQPREVVPPGFPKIVPGDETRPKDRRDLAAWLTDPGNPLTARVMVNRVWRQHFGRGLVATPSDFGVTSKAPTHPELLDWLASEFVRDGWSLKALHRLILSSKTWRQAVVDSPDRLLYRGWLPKRLEGEVIRDSLLEISGRLNPAMYGPGVMPPIPAEVFKGASGWSPSKDSADHGRRSIYIFARRNLRFPFLEVFDAPDSNLSCSARQESTTAPQSLTLLNAADVVEAARQVAESLPKNTIVASAYRRILGRDPSAEEADLAERFLQRSPAKELCRALFNLNEFVYAY